MRIDVDYLKSRLREQVPEHRYIHSLGVTEEAKKLALRFGADPVKAEIAGILHDYAKYWPKDQLAKVIKEHSDLSDELLEYSAELWHGPVASVIIQREFHITDLEIINAIRFHTSGREEMSLLEKIVCLADYIEPARDYPGVDEIRALTDQSLEKALIKAFDGTIQFLIMKQWTIYPLTIITRNNLINQITNE